MASSVFLTFTTGQSLTSPTLITPTIQNPTFTGQELEADGTSGAPSKSFTSEPTLGLWRSAAGTMTLQGAFIATTGLAWTAGNLVGGSTSEITFGARARTASPADGEWIVENSARTIGALLKADALPTVGSGFGGSPAVTAGSTPFAGSVNVGTGGAATTGVITFGGTAFPSAPCVAIGQSAGTFTTGVATTTQLTLTAAVAWPAGTIVNWICVSSK